MNYPVPSPATQFSWLEEDNIIHSTSISEDWSREQEIPIIMSEYLDHVLKYSRLYRSIPFVEQIYLCNSITFNALHEESDIDILIIAKPGMLRLARAWSRFMFSII